MQVQVKNLSKDSHQTLDWGKCDLCDFDCGIVVGVRLADLSISQSANLLGF